MTTPRPGDVAVIGRECSVQFVGDRALRMRVVFVDSNPTYHGWFWLTGYLLNKRGEAVNKREVYVMKAGLRVAPAVEDPGLRGRQGCGCGALVAVGELSLEVGAAGSWWASSQCCVPGSPIWSFRRSGPG